MLDILVGYSALDTTAICTLVAKDGVIEDFAIVPHESDDPEVLVPRGVRAGTRLLRPYRDGHDVRIVTPSVRDTDALSEALETVSYEEGDQTLVDTPPESPSALARWFLDGNHNGALIHNIEEPVTLYTDASVQEGEVHTGGIYAVDATDHVIFFGNRTFDTVESVSEAEFKAGLAGLLTVQAAGVKDIVWVSDNHDAQDMIEYQQPPSNEAVGLVSHCTDDFNGLDVADIKGSANILADALAADARHESVASDMLYTAPPLQDRRNKLTEVYLQPWPYNVDGN